MLGDGSRSSTTALVLTKKGDGSSYAPWLLSMKGVLMDINNTFVSAYGAQILTDQEAFESPLNARLAMVEGEEKRSILKV